MGTKHLGSLSEFIRGFRKRHHERLVNPCSLKGTVLLTGCAALSLLGRSWGVVGPWTCPAVLGINIEPLPASILKAVSEPCLSEFKEQLAKYNGEVFVDVTKQARHVFLEADAILCRPPVTAYLEHIYGCLQIKVKQPKRCIRSVSDFLFEPEEINEIRKGVRMLALVLNYSEHELLEATGIEGKR